MKIALVTSWPPRHCGIATYSQDLVRALRAQGHEVHIFTFSDGGRKGEKNIHKIMKTKKANITDCNWSEKLYNAVNKLEPDVVHIQHEYALYNYKEDFSTGLMRVFFKWYVEASFPIVVTYHSIYTVLDRPISKFMELAVDITNAAIVHEEYQKIYLPINIDKAPDNVFVIPHGAKGVTSFNSNAKKEYGLEGKKVVGLIGWWEPNKGFERVIKLWHKIKKKIGKNAVLVVAGDARPGSTSGQYYKPKLLREIAKSKAKNSIKVITKSFTPEEYDKVLSSFDLMVLPYARASQSGNLAHSFALGVPVVATAMEGLKAEVEASKAGIAVPPEDDFELERAIVMLMMHDDLRKRYAKRASHYVTKKIKWDIVAKKHVRLYENVGKKMRAACAEREREEA